MIGTLVLVAQICPCAVPDIVWDQKPLTEIIGLLETQKKLEDFVQQWQDFITKRQALVFPVDDPVVKLVTGAKSCLREMDSALRMTMTFDDERKDYINQWRRNFSPRARALLSLSDRKERVFSRTDVESIWGAGPRYYGSDFDDIVAHATQIYSGVRSGFSRSFDAYIRVFPFSVKVLAKQHKTPGMAERYSALMLGEAAGAVHHHNTLRAMRLYNEQLEAMDEEREERASKALYLYAYGN